MNIETKDFRVGEGDKVDLDKWPTKVNSVYKSKGQYKKLLKDHVAQLSAQQRLHYASNRHAILLIFQAMDAGGKDGAIRHVMSGVNPQGCQVFSFKHPSGIELEHDFLWRTTRDLPERGRIGIFNRSYYEEVLILRVHPELLRGEALVDPPGDDRGVLASSLPLHYEFGATPPRQRHPGGQILPSPFEGRAAQALPFAYRRAGQELEIQRSGYQGKGLLEGVYEGVRGVPRRNKHQRRSLVCRSRGRQAQRATDRLPDRPRYVRRTSKWPIPKRPQNATRSCC